jgi:hypothetical protein
LFGRACHAAVINGSENERGTVFGDGLTVAEIEEMNPDVGDCGLQTGSLPRDEENKMGRDFSPNEPGSWSHQLVKPGRSLFPI